MGKKLKRAMYPTPDLSNKLKLHIDDLFGGVSDTHMGSSHEALRELEMMYDDFVDRGIKQVFHAGDLVDGEGVYRGQDRYIRKHGYEAQANWAMAKYPQRKDMTTYMISGNHDMSFYINSGADIVNYVCSQRKDLEYLGMYYARVQDGRFKLDILHPTGGAYYSKSYGIQKWIRNNEMPARYPDVMMFGHWHVHGYFADHGIECLMMGSFQHPNEYAIRRGFTGDIGGWILETDRDKRKLKGLKLEWRKK